jgi:hypothetical protein
MNLVFKGSVWGLLWAPGYRLVAGPVLTTSRPSYRPEWCLFSCLTGFRFFVDLRCVALRSEFLFAPFIGVNALSTSSFGLTCLLVTCVIKRVRIFLNRYPGS